MSIIKIRSKNIFQTPQTNTSKIISSCEGEVRNLTSQLGDVSDILTANVYEVNLSDKPLEAYIFVGENSNKTTIFFEITDISESGTTSSVRNKNDIIFPKPEKIIADINSTTENKVLNYSLRCNLYWSLGGDTSLVLESKTFDVLKYDEESNFVKIDAQSLVIEDAFFQDQKALIKIELFVSGIYYTASSYTMTKGEQILNSYENKFILPTNELVQQDNVGLKRELLAENVIKRYYKGKEIVSLKCSISNYYDIYGNLVICPENSLYPAVFEKYDVVEPYIHKNHIEVPLNINKDGTPKRFEIIGIDFTYKGVVWQELTLQEYVE